MHSYNTRAESASPTPPRYYWPKPGEDVPRLAWGDWLRLVATQLATDYPGPTGHMLSNIVGALADQAEALGAHDPLTHEARADTALRANAAWIAALEAEAAGPPGHWTTTHDLPDDCHLGSWGGHPDEWTDDQARRGWYSCGPDDVTYLN